MRQFLIKVLIFMFLSLILGVGYIITSKYLFNKTMGLSTAKQIETSFLNAETLDYKMLVLGSSIAYRGINPDSITTIKSYNFAHDNDGYNQLYYKLMRLDSLGTNFNSILLQVDYFIFSHIASTRNSIYKTYFPSQYMLDYQDDVKETKAFNNFIELNYSHTFSRYVGSLFSSFKKNIEIPVLKSNGQYVIPYKEAKENQTTTSRKDYFPLPLQLNYFNKILNYAKNKNITVFLVFPPVRKYILEYPSDKDKAFLDSLWRTNTNSKIHFLNYSNDKRFSLNCYSDYVHLNSKGADKFSCILDDDFKKIIGEK